jgi:hypothetical protein
MKVPEYVLILGPLQHTRAFLEVYLVRAGRPIHEILRSIPTVPLTVQVLTLITSIPSLLPMKTCWMKTPCCFRNSLASILIYCSEYSILPVTADDDERSIC